MKIAAIILSGCGHLDGSEIRESILTLLELEKFSIKYKIFAPNIAAHHVVNHLTGEKQNRESRNTLVEASRIARGDIEDLNDLNHNEFDCLIIPGGFGVAKNLSTIAMDGENASIINIMEKTVLDFYKAKKPIGAICIAPALVAKILQNHGVQALLTLGASNPLLSKIEAKEVICKATEISYDSINKIVCTPAYMTDEPLLNISEGIHKLIEKINEIS